MKKKALIIVLIIIVLGIGLFILAECRKQNDLEKTLLAGHSWGETPNESKTIGMTDTLFEYKVYFTSKTTHSEDNELNKIYYCIKENKDNQNVTKADYDNLVNKWYDGSIKYELEFRDESKVKNPASDNNIIYITISNDKY